MAVNDRTLFWRGPVQFKRVRFDGTVLAEWTHWRLSADRLSTGEIVVPDSIAVPEDPATEMIIATMHDSVARHFFAEDVALSLPDPQGKLTVDRVAGKEWRVTVAAETLLKDVCLFVDRIHPDATVSDMMVTLLPGESFTFVVSSPTDLDAEGLGAIPVFRCANQLVAVEA